MIQTPVSVIDFLLSLLSKLHTMFFTSVEFKPSIFICTSKLKSPSKSKEKSLVSLSNAITSIQLNIKERMAPSRQRKHVMRMSWKIGHH